MRYWNREENIMTPRERFLTACNHQEPDRIPVALGGTANKMYESTMRAAMDFYGISQDKMEFYPGKCWMPR